MRNNICKFTLEQSQRIIGMAQAIVGQHYSWLDSERQYDLAMNTYFHLCEFNNCEVSPNPAYQVIKNIVNNRAENMKLLRRKTLKQRNLEKLAEPTADDTEKLDEMKSGRKINNISYEGLLEDQGDLLELGYTKDVETMIVESDVERIYRALKGKPFALKIVELVRYGYDYEDVAQMLGVTYRTILLNLDGGMATELKPKFDIPAAELAAKYYVVPVVVAVEAAPVPVVEVAKIQEQIMHVLVKAMKSAKKSKKYFNPDQMQFDFMFAGNYEVNSGLYAMGGN